MGDHKKNCVEFQGFLKNCENILGITVAIKHKIVWHVSFFCKAFLNYVRSHFCILYSSHCLEKRQIFP